METQTKQCLRCKQEKPISEFYIRKDTNRPRGECAACWIKRNNERFREYHINYHREHRKNNPEMYAKLSRDYRLRHPEKTLFRQARGRAKRNGIPFNIEISDIFIPEFCPVLGIKLEMSIGQGPKDCSPSLDRIDNTLGYIKGNIRVISFRANSLKKDATIQEIEAILEDLKKILAKNGIKG